MTGVPEPDVSEVLAGLRQDYPPFAFRRETLGRHGPRWVARRRQGASPGVHTVITASLAELRDALDRDARSQRRCAPP